MIFSKKNIVLNEYLNKAHKDGKGLGEQSVVAEKGWGQEHEATGLTASTVGQQEKRLVLCSLPPFDSVRHSSLWIGAALIQAASSPLN